MTLYRKGNKTYNSVNRMLVVKLLETRKTSVGRKHTETWRVYRGGLRKGVGRRELRTHLCTYYCEERTFKNIALDGLGLLHVYCVCLFVCSSLTAFFSSFVVCLMFPALV